MDKDNKAACDDCQRRTAQRRTVLKSVLGLGVSLPFFDAVKAALKDPAAAPPTAGDQFVFALGNKKGEGLQVEDLALGEPQQLAYPMEATASVVRDGSRGQLPREDIAARADPNWCCIPRAALSASPAAPRSQIRARAR
jgi:hypothetical protein